MPTIELSRSHRDRGLGHLRLETVNVWYDDDMGAFFGRPALVNEAVRGAGPIRGEFYLEGLFNNDVFYLSGSQLWRGANIVGAVAGEDRARMAGGFDADQPCLVFCADGGKVFRYIEGSLSRVTIPDNDLVVDVKYFGNRFLYFLASGRFRWSEINDPANISGLSFAEAEYRPDGFRGAATTSTQLYIFGADSTEVWYLTQDADNPFAPDLNSRLDFGAIGPDGVVVRDGAVYVLTSGRDIYRIQGGFQAIADDSVRADLKGAPLASVRMGIVQINARDFLIVQDNERDTWVSDGKFWYRWRRNKRTGLGISGTIIKNGVTYAGDLTSGQIYRFDASVFADGVGHLERVVSAFVPLQSGVQPAFRATLNCQAGVGGLVSNLNPVVEMRLSRDRGHTFGTWTSAPLGMFGEYGKTSTWRGLGHIKPPGVVFQFKCTDPVAFSPMSIVLNEGRS